MSSFDTVVSSLSETQPVIVFSRDTKIEKDGFDLRILLGSLLPSNFLYTSRSRIYSGSGTASARYGWLSCFSYFYSGC
jgi:hypothetical protein